MKFVASNIAEYASFHAFINAYLREIDAGIWKGKSQFLALSDFPYELKGNEVLEIFLPESQQCIVMDVSYKSKVGRHHFQGVYVRTEYDEERSSPWQSADIMYLLIALVRQIYQRQNTISVGTELSESIRMNEVELLGRLLGSYQTMAYFLSQRAGDAALTSLDFINSEQSILYGHWLHPTPKSQQGITPWQQTFYSPELCGHFKLHYFSADKSLVKEGSSLAKSTSELLYAEVSRYDSIELANDHVLVPVHPLQAPNLLLEEWVKVLIEEGRLNYLGELGADYTATSSVRTVVNEASEWMVKLSIPVKITNSLRTNKRRELEDGMVIESYLNHIGFLTDRPQFKVVDDPAYITINHPKDHQLDSGFEVVLRRNLFTEEEGQGICSILTLVQDSIPKADGSAGSSLLNNIILDLAAKENRSLDQVAIDWFDRYWHCAIESILSLYDGYGIALEAHQQNSLLDVSAGYPSCYYYRDNQGFYLSEHFKAELAEVGSQLNLTNIFYDDDKIFTAISYYVFVNQLFAVIYRLGADGLLDEEVLVERSRKKLLAMQNNMQGVGKDFIHYILSSERLDYKTNLLARVNNIDELQEGMEHAVYSTIVNPLYSASKSKPASKSISEFESQKELIKGGESERGAVYG
ncbi:IucA/IucC family protein [Oleispira antarctica RB-8]|uniref:IucA/IucC family protein n=1 Tax=Oleispira antarctica RB-8 TaxID=698738 RepID=R4YUE6_OLEAN|nr:IucA/IucC family protein [Oleispira antarctica RB-8]